MFASAADRRVVRLAPSGRSIDDVGPSSSTVASTRPPIRRTASTADVRDDASDLNTVALIDRDRIIDPNDMSDDDDEELGVQEDWIPEDDDDDEAEEPGQHTVHSRIDRRAARTATAEKDPFTVTPPPSGISSSSAAPTMMMMMLDSPPSSPTTARQSAKQRSSTTRRSTGGNLNDAGSDAERDDVDNNPFLSKPNLPASTASRKRKAPSSDISPPANGKVMAKVSYVFRGKRITYDAPLASLFPEEDSDDERLNQRLGAKSGPRVLFPNPPVITRKPEPAVTASDTISSPPSTSNRTNVELMLQTPRRGPTTATSSSTTTATNDGGGAFVTPAIVRTFKSTSSDSAAAKGKERDERAGKPSIPFIPPTPASLPQKALNSNANGQPPRQHDTELERLRFIQAFEGIQTASRTGGMSNEARAARRYNPYPPR